MTVQLMAVQTTSPHTVEPEIGESKGLDLIWLHINTVYQRKNKQLKVFWPPSVLETDKNIIVHFYFAYTSYIIN